MASTEKKKPDEVEVLASSIVEIVLDEFKAFERYMATAQDRAMMHRQFKGYAVNIESRVKELLRVGRTDTGAGQSGN